MGITRTNAKILTFISTMYKVDTTGSMFSVIKRGLVEDIESYIGYHGLTKEPFTNYLNNIKGCNNQQALRDALFIHNDFTPIQIMLDVIF